MEKLELQEELINLRKEISELIANGEVEKRELTDTENQKMIELKSKIDEIENNLKQIEAENAKLIEEKANNNKETIKETKQMEVRLFDLVKGIANNSLTDEQRAFVDGNRINSKQFRAAIQATATDHGKENVPVDKMPLEVAIRNATVLDKVGAMWFNNAVGDIKLVKYSGSNTSWAESENAQASDGAGTFKEVVLQPKRLSSVLTVSRQFLEQSPENAEGILINDLARAIATKIDQTVFGSVSGSSSQPAGLFYDTGYTQTGGAVSAITFDDILDVEANVEAHNGTDFIFVCDPKVKYALRGTQTASGLQMVWHNNELDGRKAVVSNSVNAKSILAFDPADLACATWEYSMIVDPYSLADKNQIKIVVNYLFDAKLKGERIAAKIFS